MKTLSSNPLKKEIGNFPAVIYFLFLNRLVQLEIYPHETAKIFYL